MQSLSRGIFSEIARDLSSVERALDAMNRSKIARLHEEREGLGEALTVERSIRELEDDLEAAMVEKIALEGMIAERLLAYVEAYIADVIPRWAKEDYNSAFRCVVNEKNKIERLEKRLERAKERIAQLELEELVARGVADSVAQTAEIYGENHNGGEGASST